MFIYFYFWLCYGACGILVPQPGLEPSLAVKHHVLSTEPPGNYQNVSFNSQHRWKGCNSSLGFSLSPYLPMSDWIVLSWFVPLFPGHAELPWPGLDLHPCRRNVESGPSGPPGKSTTDLFYCLYSFAFSMVSRNWTHLAGSLFKLASLT